MKTDHTRRRGAMSFEVVMSAAVLLPLSGAALFLGIKMFQYLYQIISTMVGWPYP